MLFGLGSALSALVDPEAADRLAEASEMLVKAGDMETAAEVECILAQMAFDTGDAPGVNRHIGRAVELVRGRPPSASYAQALSQAARFQTLAGKWAESTEMGLEAERMATKLGLDAIRADTLVTMGTARTSLGDPRGRADLETAIELAEAANALQALLRALNNLAWNWYGGIDMRQARELNERQYETARRYGHMRQAWWARTQLSQTAFETGRWDEALEHAEAVIAYVEAGNPLYAEAGCRLQRAAITFARGDDGAFDADIDRSLALAAAATDPQARWPISLYAAYLRLWAGDRGGAQRLLDSTLEAARASEVAMDLIHYEAALLAALLERDPAERAIPPVGVSETPRQRATAALLEGDLVVASDALEELGKVNDEAYLRVRLGERLLGEGRADEGRAQIERALAFYRGVRGTDS